MQVIPLMLDKNEILLRLHSRLAPSVERISKLALTHQQKAQQVNALVAEERDNLSASILQMWEVDRGTAALVIQYCCTVAGLEYRHQVWPYEYMAFSRRIGELWEAFCRTAWTYPADTTVVRMDAPNFAEVRKALLQRITANLGTHDKAKEVMTDVSTLFEIVGEINMKEDEVFRKADIPYVIDFKSGFGSNEKGNMLRLLTVGRAYHIWDHRTKLMLLVRQDENNNYLKVLRRSNLWEVYTGADTYKKIEEITGADIQLVRDEVIDWRDDLSDGFYRYLKNQPTDLTSYLVW
ncbi:hypothetical protein [Sphingobium sp. ba1]|jgi:hypothetical protein|uniref:hypothetical protein n=1 Tax=Sphingobium sp. ba1 TaxID=1522072 RepID=UPI00056BD20A|nr:hypothetical protein [Sphingobium sp. ba1]